MGFGSARRVSDKDWFFWLPEGDTVGDLKRLPVLVGVEVGLDDEGVDRSES